MISCYHLIVPHPGQERPLLEDLSFEIARGDFAEIVGPSGAGKSVLFSILSLRRPAPSGKCIISGRNLDRLNEAGLAELRRKVSSCSQRPALLEGRTVLENLLLPLVARGEHDGARAKVEALIAGSPLETLAHTPAGALSHSETRLAAIFRALVGRPSLILIDGGLEGLGDHQAPAMAALKTAHGRGATVVLTARGFSPLDECRTVAMRLSDRQLEIVERLGDDPLVMDGVA